MVLSGIGWDEVLERFQAGWARRRALCALLERGEPSGVDEALRLVETLQSRASTRWCLSALLQRPELSAADVERVRDFRSRALDGVV